MEALTPLLPEPLKCPGWKVYGNAYKHYIFRTHNTSTFNAMRFDENPFKCQCEREDKRVKCFRFCTFIGRFQVTSGQ